MPAFDVMHGGVFGGRSAAGCDGRPSSYRRDRRHLRLAGSVKSDPGGYPRMEMDIDDILQLKVGAKAQLFCHRA